MQARHGSVLRQTEIMMAPAFGRYACTYIRTEQSGPVQWSRASRIQQADLAAKWRLAPGVSSRYRTLSLHIAHGAAPWIANARRDVSRVAEAVQVRHTHQPHVLHSISQHMRMACWSGGLPLCREAVVSDQKRQDRPLHRPPGAAWCFVHAMAWVHAMRAGP